MIFRALKPYRSMASSRTFPPRQWWSEARNLYRMNFPLISHYIHITVINIFLWHIDIFLLYHVCCLNPQNFCGFTMIFPLKKLIFLWSSHDFPIKTPRVSPLGHRLPSCWMVRAQRQAATRRARGLLRQVWNSPLDSLHVEAYLIIYVSLYIYIWYTSQDQW